MDAEAFIREKLAVSVPWGDLVQQSNLQKILLAIVQRLDRFDRTLTAGSTETLSIVPSEDLQLFRDRIDVLENVLLQSRIEELKKSEGPFSGVAADAKKKFNLSSHVIPLTQLKGKVDSFEVALQATAQQVDETNSRIVKLVSVFETEFGALRKDFKVDSPLLS
jgi:hypothetical protein